MIWEEIYEEYHYELSIVSPSDNSSIIAYIGSYYGLNIRGTFNEIDEISFMLPYNADSITRTVNPVWDNIYEDVIISLETKIDDTVITQKFFTVDLAELVDGEKEIKQVHAYSKEYKLGKKKIRGFAPQLEGSAIPIRLYVDGVPWDNANPANSGILNYILEYKLENTWSVSYMSTSLESDYRIFDISSKSIIEVIKEIQTQFDCVFIFDTLNNAISIKNYDEVGSNKGLILDVDNYIKDLNKKIKIDEIITRMFVEGAKGAVISTSNITGQSYLDDFDFFKSTSYMSQDLIDALDAYEIVKSNNQITFASYLADLSTKQSELDDLYYNISTGLYKLQNDLILIENHLDESIKFGISGGQNYLYWKIQETLAITYIGAQNVSIGIKEDEIVAVELDISTLQSSLSYASNFTTAQLQELNNYIYEDTIKCNSEDPDILIAYGQQILQNKSQPPVEFSVELVDVYGAKSEQFAWDKLNLGDLVTVTHNDFGIDTEVRVMAYSYDIDGSSLSIDFSNKEYWNNDLNYLNDLITKSKQSADTVEKERYQFKDYFENDKENINDFITSPIDTAENEVVIGDGSIINRRGFYMHDVNDALGQMKILGNRIVFTKDNWDTYSLAITSAGIQTDGAFELYSENNRVVIDGDGLKIYGGNSSDPLQVFNENNFKVFNLDSDGNIQLNNEDGSQTILDSYGMDTKFIKWFKNMCNNSSFEVYDGVTFLPAYWSGTGVASGDSSWFGTVSCKLTTTGDYIQTDSSYAINPNFYDDVVSTTNLSRVSFHKKRGKVKVEVLDLDNASQAYTLTDTDGNTGALLEFDYNLNYVPEAYSVNFDHFEFGATTQFIVKFTNTDLTYDAFIDSVIIEPDYTGKRPSFYTDGANSLGINTVYNTAYSNEILAYNKDSTTAVTTDILIATLTADFLTVSDVNVAGTFVGSASVSTLLTYTLKKDDVTINTFKQQVTGAYYDTLCFDVPILSNTAVEHTFDVYLNSGAGTFTLDADEQNFYINGSGFIAVPPLPPEFIMTIDTTQSGSASNTFILPLDGVSTYNFDVDWGDTIIETVVVNTDQTHVYSAGGIYEVKITGDFPHIYFNNSGDKLKLVDVSNWGTIAWGSMEKAFSVCLYATFTATDTPDLSNVTNMSQMFFNCRAGNPSVANWDTSGVTDMSTMFASCYVFNQSVASFDTSNVLKMDWMFNDCRMFDQSVANFNTSLVTDMSAMFYGCWVFNQSVSNFNTSGVIDMSDMLHSCYLFNQSVSNFNTSSVTNMNNMFTHCEVFDQSVSNFNTSLVTDMDFMFASCYVFNQSVASFDTSNVGGMRYMFYDCTAFNQSLSTFVTTNVTNMESMFNYCSIFNQPLSTFDTSSLEQMSNMFDQALAFNQDISSWDISSLVFVGASKAFRGSAFSTTNYDLLLVGWEGQVENPNLYLGVENTQYSAGAPATARTALVANGWIITDLGQV